MEDREQIAFLRDYSLHEPAIRAFVRSLIPGRDDVQEVMQEVAVDLWKKYSQRPDGVDFRHWALRVARIEVLTFYRNRSRDRMLLDPTLVELLADHAYGKVDTWERQREWLERCLEKLHPAHRELLSRCYQRDSTLEAIAGELGKTPVALHKSLQRIRAALIDCTQRLKLGEAS
ncbi:MAG: sigma-70 family RNA polymerase sigma factor [Pirellulaceae bacterium]